jgi:hypothetical protein
MELSGTTARFARDNKTMTLTLLGEHTPTRDPVGGIDTLEEVHRTEGERERATS